MGGREKAMDYYAWKKSGSASYAHESNLLNLCYKLKWLFQSVAAIPVYKTAVLCVCSNCNNFMSW